MSSKLKVNNIIPSTGTQIGISTTGGGINLLTGTVVTGIITASGFDGPITQSGDFTIDDYVVHAGDTNTKFGFPAADTFAVTTAGTERVRVSAAGTVTVSSDDHAGAVSWGGDVVIANTTGARLTIGDTGSGEKFSIAANGDINLYSYLNGDNINFHTTNGSGTGNRFIIDSDGDLWAGVAPTTHHSNRHAFFHNAGDNYVSITGGTGSTAGIVFGDSVANDGGNYESYIAHWNNNNHLYIYTDRGNKGLELENGGDVKIIDGNLVVANGHGIDFSSTGGGSGTSNESEILTDYEHGEWTPVLQHYISGGFSAPSYSAAGTVVGRYTKIGNMVHISASFLGFNISNAHGSSFGRVTGLPFTSTNHPNNRDVISAMSDAFTTGGVNFSTYWNQTNLNSMKHGTSVFDWAVLSGGSTKNLVISGHYTAA